MTEKSLHLRSEDILFHAYNRGVNRQPIFFDQSDYEVFIALMCRFIEQSPIELLAFALMPNHYHFIIHQLAPYAMSKFVKRVCERYVKYLNKKRRRVGGLFQGNYVPKWVDNDAYLLYLSRYIHLNPVSAGLVQKPDDWRFSSCAAYKLGNDTGLVMPGRILEMAGGVSNYWDYLVAENVHCDDAIEKYLLDREIL